MSGINFISGATGGIGGAFCRAVASGGGDLFVTGRSREKLIALKEEIESEYGVKVFYRECELTDASDREKLVEEIRATGRSVDRIINVAGVDIQKSFADYTSDKVLFQLRVNCEATVSLTHALLSECGKGTEIITVGSMSGVSPMPYFALYSATKAMLANFYTSLHYELKERGIKVTVVMPGGVPTRPDVIEDIKGQGLWGRLSSKPADFVAKGSLKAAAKNKIRYIPGSFNRFLFVVMKLVPKKIVLRFIARRWKKQTKDAF